MKFVEFLNENKTEKLITPAILKREFKEEFGLIRPKIKVDMYTEKNHKDTETKYVEHDNSTYAAIEHFFIKQGGRQDDKQFFVFNREKAKVNSRMQSLLQLFGLEDRIVVDENGKSHCIDWEKIDKIRGIKLMESINFLKQLGV